MSVRVLLGAFALGLFLCAPASAGAQRGLSVWPARTTIAAGSTALIHVANHSRRAAVIDARLARLTLDPRGTPRIGVIEAGTPLVVLRPRRLFVPPGAAVSVRLAARAAGAAAGDHPLLVLLVARSSGAGIGVSLRIGVPLEVRVPGAVHRRIEFGRVRMRGRRMELVVRNRGNVAERVGRALVALQVWRGRRLVAVLRPQPRDLLPGTRGIVEFRIPRRLRGPARAVPVAPFLGLRGRSHTVAF